MKKQSPLVLAALAAVASCAGCQTPRPDIAIGTPSTPANAAAARATITPNQFPVSNVILEFGRRPTANHAVSIIYSSEPESYALARILTPPQIPTLAPFEAVFRFPPLANGEFIDYQFKVTHGTEQGGNLFFWSERKTFQVTTAVGGQAPGGGGGGVVVVPQAPDLLPSLGTPAVLTRPLPPFEGVPTPSGGMFRVNDLFCSNLQNTVPTTVDVPDLVWGVIGVDIEAANAAFDVQLIDATDSNNLRVIDTLQLPQGFPANQPLVQKSNFPGRSTTLRVILNPTFQASGGSTTTHAGCFTDPFTPTQALDPRALLIKVDTNNSINESDEVNNELRF